MLLHLSSASESWLPVHMEQPDRGHLALPTGCLQALALCSCQWEKVFYKLTCRQDNDR